MSPALPWELLDMVVHQAYYEDYDTLRSLSLTCRSLRPLAIWLMLHRTHLQSRDQTFALCDFFRTKAGSLFRGQLKSLIVSPSDAPFVPLLNMLPNLSSLVFTSREYKKYRLPEDRPTMHFHPSILHNYRIHGMRIRTLSLYHLSFQTYSDFFRLVLAFPNATQLVCHGVVMKSPERNIPATDLWRNKLFQRLRLETIQARINPILELWTQEWTNCLLLDPKRCRPDCRQTSA